MAMDVAMTAIDAVRKRPGMYIGDVDGDGTLHMLLEVVANAYDQHFAGRCSQLDIHIAADGTITIEDDGPASRCTAATASRPSRSC